MSTPMPEHIREAQRLADDYQSTVHTLIAFAAYVVHTGVDFRPNSHFGFGRRMETSGDNPVAQSTEVRPDLIAQKDERFGFVVEVKRSTSRHEGDWARHLKQLRKYDDDLTGWWTQTQRIANWNAAILIHQSRSRRLVETIRDAYAEDPESVGTNSVIIEFNLSSELETFIFFRLEWGKIIDIELRPRLTDGVSVPRDKVLRSFPSVKFYDAEPPLPWLLTMLWTDLLPANWNRDNFDQKLNAWPIRVSVIELTEELQRAYGSSALERDERSAEFPQKKWIRRALDALVSIHHAIPHDEPGEYVVLFRPIRQDVLSRFAELLHRVEGDQPTTGQLALPLDEPE